VEEPSDADLTDRIEEIALQYPSYGYRRIMQAQKERP